MRIEIALAGCEENVVRSLQDWVQQEKIEGVEVQPAVEPTSPGRMGFELIPMLSVVLGAPAVVALVRCLQAWTEQRQPKTRLRLKVGKIIIELETDNMPNPEILIDHVVPLVNAAADNSESNDLD